MKYVAKISKEEICDFVNKGDDDASNFISEVNIISRLDHPTILKFIGFSLLNFKKQRKPAIVTEFVKQGSLENILELEERSIAKSDWNNTKKLIIIYGIASEMLYLHQHDILHLDLKASNILIEANFYPKLSDFGMSKYLKEEDYIKLENKTIFRGTPTHASPEIWKKSEYTKASDVYAFSLTVFEIMTNDKPFKNIKGIFNIMQAVSIFCKRPQFVYPIPKRCRKLIEDCWSDKPEKRPSFDQI